MTGRPALVVAPATAALIAAGHTWVGTAALDLACTTCAGRGEIPLPATRPCTLRCPQCLDIKDRREGVLPDGPTTFLLVDTAGDVWGTLHDTQVLLVRSTGAECHVISDHICIDGEELVHVSQYGEGSPDISDEAAGTWTSGGHAIHADTFTSVSTRGGCPACEGQGCIGGWVADGGTICWLCHGYHRVDGPLQVPGLPVTPCVTTVDLEELLEPVTPRRPGR